MKRTHGLSLLTGLALLLPGTLQAAPEKYALQPLLQSGDGVEGSSLHVSWISVQGLNDQGQFFFSTGGGDSQESLARYADGKATMVIEPGKPAPFGKWPNFDQLGPVTPNRNGNAAFSLQDLDRQVWLGTFMFEAKSGQVVPIALPEMPAVGDLIFEEPGIAKAAINNRDEIAFPARVKNAAGKRLGIGLFFRAADGTLQVVMLPRQAGPDGVPLVDATIPTLNDAGRIAFLSRRLGDSHDSAYLWEQGALTPVAIVGAEAPGGGRIAEVLGAWVNNQNRSVLVAVRLNRAETGLGVLYRWSEGKLTPLVLPNQPMPGGGRFVSLFSYWNVSFPNDHGQHAFTCRLLEEGERRGGAYLLEVDGTVSRILKQGDNTDLGPISGVSVHVGLNNKGQALLAVNIPGKPFTIVLLTPVGP